MTSRPLIVGQAPSSRGPTPDGPLSGRAGKRVAALVGLETLAPTFEVVNLLPTCPGRARGKGHRFPAAEARAAAAMLERFSTHERVVLLGRGVARAFDLDLDPLERRVERDRRWLLVPHPSGVNLWWNDKANVEAASVALRAFVGARRAA